MRNVLRGRVAFAPVLVSVLLAACSGGEYLVTSSNGSLHIDVASRTDTMVIGESDTVLVQKVNPDGSTQPASGISWSSSNPNVVDVANGPAAGSAVVAAHSLGNAWVRASLDGLSDSAYVMVFDSIVAVEVSPKSLTLAVGSSSKLNGKALSPKGTQVTSASLTWVSTDTSVATVSSSGTVTGKKTGQTKITGKASKYADTSTVSVTTVSVAYITLSASSTSILSGQTATLTTTAYDGSGNVLTGRSASYASSNAGVASVDANGVVTGVAAGSARITATVEGQSAFVDMTVANVPVASVSVSAPSSSLVQGSTMQLTATARDASGNAITGRTVSWSSSNSGVASVSSSGVVTGVAAGSATISATVDGVSGSTSITVSSVPVASVTVSPASASMSIGGTSQLSATLRDASGNVLTGRTVSWSSSNSGIASVSSSGLVTGVAAGSATITATSGGVSGTSSITVAQATVASVSVALNASTLTTGQTTQATATARDASGNVISGRTVAWSSSNTAVATVSGSGVVTAVAAGSANIAATVDGVNGSAALSVTQPAVASVSVSPGSASVNAGSTVQLSATLRDASGNVLTGRTVTWSSSSSGVATVSSSGLVSGVAAGGATITATSGGVSGTSSISVTSGSTSSGSAPEPAAGDVVLLQDNFDSGSLSNYAKRGVTNVISNGRSGSAVRFPYTSSSYDNLLEANFSTSTDLYIRYWYRTSVGADPTCGGQGGSGMKWFMAWRANNAPRYTMGVGLLGNNNAGNEFTSHDNGSTSMPNPFLQNITKSYRLATTNDGNWHKYTVHFRVGTGGYEQIWIDGNLVLDDSGLGYDHDANGINLIQFPGTVVQWYSGCDFTIDVDDLVAWHK